MQERHEKMLNLMGIADPDGEGMITRERLKRVTQWLTVRLDCCTAAQAAQAGASSRAIPF